MKWTAKVASVFDVSPVNLGKFDIVYSWGVLHHTGDMWRAIKSAADLVDTDGRFAIAIYSATSCDSMWKAEKKFYSRLPRAVQWSLQQIYMLAFLAGKTLLGGNPISYVRNYSETRGMNFSHDVHDWLGGYPYETATAIDIHDSVCKMGFVEERSFPLPVSSGLFGSGCHEFVFRRASG
jgi:2-polyprenyl-6-hydroxyphenyl methylase/3-demethylubiquinone-9 3-methyltransferase